MENRSIRQETTFVKAVTLREFEDVAKIESEISMGNILIIRITPLAKKSVDDTKKAINRLCDYAKEVNGDIARLGEERIVITPSTVRIWRSTQSFSKESSASRIIH